MITKKEIKESDLDMRYIEATDDEVKSFLECFARKQITKEKIERKLRAIFLRLEKDGFRVRKIFVNHDFFDKLVSFGIVKRLMVAYNINPRYEYSLWGSIVDVCGINKNEIVLTGEKNDC